MVELLKPIVFVLNFTLGNDSEGSVLTIFLQSKDAARGNIRLCAIGRISDRVLISSYLHFPSGPEAKKVSHLSLAYLVLVMLTFVLQTWLVRSIWRLRRKS
jgi:hypothetical protein